MSWDVLESLNSYTAVSGANTGMSSKWAILQTAGTAVFDATVLPWGSRMIRLDQGSGSNTQYRRDRGANRAAFADHFWFYTNTLVNWGFHSFYWAADVNSCQIALQLNSDGAIQLINGNGSTVLATSAAGIIAAGTAYHICVAATVANSGGAFEVRVNGNVVLTGTGDTQNTANAYSSSFHIWCPDTVGTTLNTWFGEHACWSTNAYQGMIKSKRKALTASPTQGWNRSTGADNYALVDEAVVSTLDYVDATANGTVDAYTTADIDTGAAAIVAVRIGGYGRSTDSSVRSVNLQCISGATTSDGSNIPLQISTNPIERILETDPNTSAAWSVAAAETFDIGLKLAA
jgi:hypothetical protein